MANLNLSQFGEKLFVADADYTFVWDSVASISKKVSRNSWLNSGTLTADAPVTISQTWNNAAVAFTGLKVVGTDTASAAASNLLELWAGATPALKLSVNKAGQIIAPAGTVSAPSFCLGTNKNGFYKLNNGFAYATDTDNPVLTANYNSALGMLAGMFLGWSTNVFTQPDWDVRLWRDAANTLALRNGAAAQTFNVYGTSSSNNTVYSRLAIACDTSGNATLTTQSTGVAGTVSINGVPVGRGAGNDVNSVAIGTNAAGTFSGNTNVAVGVGALQAGGTQCVSVGYASIQTQAGSDSIGIGWGSMYATLPVRTVAIGTNSGRYITGGVTVNTSATNSLFLGHATKANASGETNQIVIGHDATGIGSNSVVLGNDSITKTALKGNVGIGTTAPGAPLEIRGTAATGVRENLLKCTVSDAGNDAFNIFNSTSVDGRFSPGFSASTFTHQGVLAFISQTNTANDTGTTPFLIFGARITSSETDPNNGTLSVVNTRPLFAWQNFTTTYMQMAANGNLGIGTTSPTSKLHVVGDAVLTGDLLGTNYTIGVPTILTQSNISITNTHSGVADSAIVITPKGTGGVIFGPKPDGTLTGGNARGTRAIDHQISRNAATQVASGTDALICGGNNNTASNQLSIVVGGASNISSGYISFIGGGQLNTSSSNYSTVAGGNTNTASSTWSTVSGGQSNTASASHSFVGGGLSNSSSAPYAFTGGGLANVCNGYASVITGGDTNTTPGNYTFIGGGRFNNCSGDNSFISGGTYGRADRQGIGAHANGRFAATGDAQKTTAVFRNKTTTDSAVELFLDGSSARYTVTSGKIISMLINITGTKSDGSAVAHYVRQYSIKNIGGTTSQVYAAVTVGTDNAAGTSIAISADDTNDSLKIEVTGVAAETWRWVASVDAVEVGHGT